jgi:hypothetical protein
MSWAASGLTNAAGTLIRKRAGTPSEMMFPNGRLSRTRCAWTKSLRRECAVIVQCVKEVWPRITANVAIVEALEGLEQIVVDHPKAADECEREHIGEERTVELPQRLVELVRTDVGDLEVEDEERDGNGHHGIREGDDPAEVGPVHVKDGSP